VFLSFPLQEIKRENEKKKKQSCLFLPRSLFADFRLTHETICGLGGLELIYTVSAGEKEKYVFKGGYWEKERVFR
jgi:hypothetical protein